MFVFLPMAFASFMGRVRNSSINITAISSQKYNCVVPENNHTSPTECSQKFGGGWRSQKKPSMEEKWTIPVMKYYINDTEQLI